jgi:4-diphosphocytidyl-2-C-methyl-D-erythritol kinase
VQLTLAAPAKINLLLDVTAALPNGYHSVAMLMQAIDLCDSVTLRTSQAPGIRLRCQTPGVPEDRRNIAWKAAEAFFETFGAAGHGIEITLEKRIPHAAGLAGGSTDGAAVLRGLRQLFHPKLSDAALCALGVKIGADIPFCIAGGLCLAQGIGEILSPLPALPPNFTLVLAKPPGGVSTKEAYAALHRRLPSLSHPNLPLALHYLTRGDWAGLFPLCANVFEQVTALPALDALRGAMRNHGALLAQMSGSGPTVFGVFEEEARAQSCAAELEQTTEEIFVCRALAQTAPGLSTNDSP